MCLKHCIDKAVQTAALIWWQSSTTANTALWEEFGNMPGYIEVYKYTWFSKTDLHVHPKCKTNEYIPCFFSHCWIWSILPCLTWASSSGPGCAHTDQPQPRKAVSSSLIKCSAGVLRCRSGICSVPIWEHRWSLASDKEQPSGWGTWLETERTWPLTSGLWIVFQN